MPIAVVVAVQRPMPAAEHVCIVKGNQCLETIEIQPHQFSDEHRHPAVLLSDSSTVLPVNNTLSSLSQKHNSVTARSVYCSSLSTTCTRETACFLGVGSNHTQPAPQPGNINISHVAKETNMKRLQIAAACIVWFNT